MTVALLEHVGTAVRCAPTPDTRRVVRCVAQHNPEQDPVERVADIVRHRRNSARREEII